MKMTYDKQANAAYIFFNKGDDKVTKTVNLSDNIIMDLGKKGEILGLEILNATSSIGKEIFRKLKKQEMDIPMVSIA